MAVGDVFEDFSANVANGDYLSVQPAAGYQAVVHNLFWAGSVELYNQEGANQILYRTPAAGAGGDAFYAYHVTNTHYIRIKNISGGAIHLAFDGVYTKEP